MKISSMSVMTVVLASLAAGCAHSKSSKESAAAPTVPAVVPEPSPAPAFTPSPKALRMPLPYRYSRRGVEIQVNYVEVVNGELQVNVALQEKRGETAEILASTMMQARTPDGQLLAYRSYTRDKTSQPNPQIHFVPNEKFFVTLAFQPPAMAGTPIELQFPTGKWWSSAAE